MTLRHPWIAAAFTLLTLPLVAQKHTHETPGTPVPAGVYQLPEPHRVTLPNGMVLVLLEKHELPLISATFALRTGSLADPAAKEGLAATTAELLRKGTATRSAEQIAEDADFIGMTFSARAGLESTEASIDYLKKDNDRALGLLAEMVLHPSFPQVEFTQFVARQSDQLRSARDNPQQMMNLFLMSALYGSNPYARPVSGTPDTLARLSNADVKSFYATYYTPPNAVLAIAGDFNAAAMETQLRSLFGGWKGTAPKAIVVPSLQPIQGRHVVLVDKPDATQTYFDIANVGVSQSSADLPQVEITNTLFGGRFTSMFNDELRIKSGYSYGASSRFSPYRQPGPFVMATYTRNATTEPAIDKSFEVLTRLHSHPLTDGDLLSAKNYIRGTFPPSLETTPALAGEYATLEVTGISRQQFNARLVAQQTATLPDINHSIDADFPTPNNYVLVMIGKASEIGAIAAKYGTVTNRKISDPGF